MIRSELAYLILAISTFADRSPYNSASFVYYMYPAKAGRKKEKR